MEIRKYQRKKRGTSKTFLLVGKVLKVTEKSILVQKANNFNQFWIDRSNASQIDFKEGDYGSFRIKVSTYLGKEADLIWNKIRLYNFKPLENEVQSDHPGFYGWLSGIINSYTKTDIEHLGIIEFEDTNGRIHLLRYFNEHEPELAKDCQISLDLRSTSKLIDVRGAVFESVRDIEYTNKEGELIQKQVKRWFPSLEIKELEY